MKFEAKRKYVITMDEQEAKELQSVLAYSISHRGSGGFTRRLNQFLSTRREEFPNDSDPLEIKRTDLETW